ncbi:hypothetical protein [Streptomyces sp. NPDC091217]|uniref:hypothetical protein n=1 Tax=Streptomyces sp. NPDC091217 TaxID=3365975 RepID=UPI00382D9B31
MRITERVLAQHVKATVPSLPKRLTAALAGEPPGQAIAGVDVGQCGSGMCASADDPVVQEIGSQDLGTQLTATSRDSMRRDTG